MIVYKITNPANGKAYIGITTGSLRKRITQHRRDARAGKKYPLHSAMRKYGVFSFVAEELMRCDSIEDLNAAEIAQIALHGTHLPNGYNITIGGRGTMGRVTSPAARAAKSAQLKRVHAEDPTIRTRISESLKELYRTKTHPAKGKRHSKEACAANSARTVARYKIPSNRVKLLAMSARAAQLPRTQKQLASASRIARDPDVRARICSSQKATLCDPVHRAAWLTKLATAQLATWQRRRDAAPGCKLPQMGGRPKKAE